MKKRQRRVQPPKAILEQLDSIERWGTDVDEAVELALAELKATKDEVEIEVLEEPSKGFFGIGAKLAKVKVSKKIPTVSQTQEEKKPKKERGPLRKEEVTEEERTITRDREERPSKKRDRNRKKSSSEKEGGKEDAALGLSYEDRALEEPIMPVVDKESLEPLEEHPGLTFLKDMIESMGLEAQVEGRKSGSDLFFFIEGKDTGTIIGKRGATLDAVQYLTSLVVNKEDGEYIRVVVDAENYRAKREKSLEKLAMRLADKVARTKRSYKLEPMNPYERKVIHATLQKDPRIVTRSEGQDPSRRVVIELKEQ